eukprot:scaffold16014_cov62-Phaeocystis_antarctica.AAC.3
MHRLHLIGQRLTHQAYDQAVALDGAHALLQLAQDLVLVLDVAVLRLPIGEERLKTLYGGQCDHRARALASSQGGVRTFRTSTCDNPFLIDLKPSRAESAVSKVSCSFVLMTMSNFAPLACSCNSGIYLLTNLRVIDLLDAVGALEFGRVPRLHQQHRVPEGADAVAKVRQVGLNVVLPDHEVAHPEERVLLPQSLLLDEAIERVEQRGDRRLEEPAHEHVGLPHVQRLLVLQPLAHGQFVLLFPESDEELVDVAVDRDVHRERELALRHQLGVALLHLGVDLLHRVARQLQQ